jgi:hypothetical protein
MTRASRKTKRESSCGSDRRGGRAWWLLAMPLAGTKPADDEKSVTGFGSAFRSPQIRHHQTWTDRRSYGFGPEEPAESVGPQLG